MTLETKRLELKPLLPGQLRLWIEDSLLLEKQLRCSYQAEPLGALLRNSKRTTKNGGKKSR